MDRCGDGTNANWTRTRISYLFVSMELVGESGLTADMRSGQSDSWCHLSKFRDSRFWCEKVGFYMSSAEKVFSCGSWSCQVGYVGLVGYSQSD